MNKTDPNRTFEEVQQEDNDEEEDESMDEESSTSDEESKEVPKWNSFKEYRNESESISMADNSLVVISIQIFKLITYLVTFFIVLAGGVLAKSLLLLMTSQLTPDRSITVKTGSLLLAVKIPEVEKYLWVWALLICFSIPELITFVRSLRMAIFKGYDSQDNFGDDKKTKNPLTLTAAVAVVLMETLHVLGLAIFVFQILPQIDVARGVMLTNCVCFMPGLLAVVSNIGVSETRKLKILFDVLALIFQISGLIAWVVLLAPKNPNMWPLPISLVLISCGWWMNYASEESPVGLIKFLANIKVLLKEREILLYRLYLVISVWKTLVFSGSALFILMMQGMNTVDFFRRTYEAFSNRMLQAEEVDMIESSFTGFSFSIPSVGGNVWWVIGVQVFSAYVCYTFGKFACKVMIQPFSFALPCGLIVPVTVVFIVITTGLRNKNLTVFEGVLPNYIFFNSPPIYDIPEFFLNEHSWIWLLWVVSQIWITFHIWTPRCERLSKVENLFATPMYSSFLVDQSVTMNRRKDTVQTREKLQSPHIIACATMWHETKPEMLEMLKSLLRMDNDQCLRRSGKNNLNDPEAETDYYTFESHIFFDDAFELENEESNRTVINGFVKDFLKSFKKATEGAYSTDEKKRPPLKYSTPYGGRLEYTLPGENKLYVHLKDKDKIRHKKRWSQVMYMYYLLGFKLMELPLPYEKIQEKAENTFILALDGDIDFKPEAVILLIDLMKKNKGLGAACGRIHPVGSGLMVWYQLFEYAIGHWLQKATEHIIGCVLCSPGCFSLFRAKALMSPNVMKRYTTKAEEPLQYVQYDQGEDRWLCTLLLQRGWRVEYSAASDAYTHCPESFKEFYTQRRRWIPSTVANIIDLLKDYKRTVRVNNDISMLYIAYQMLLLVGTILGPGTILLMLVGAFNTAFRIDNWTALYYNLLPISAFILCCLFTSQKFQISSALIISLVYGLIMMAVLVGIIMEIKDDGLLSPSSIFLLLTAGEIIIAAVLHPQEIFCLFSGVIYYVTIPSMYLLLIIYSVCNLNVVSWGTREVAKKKTKADLENEKKEAELAEKKAQRTRLFGILDAFSGNREKEQSGAMEFSLANVFRCMCCTSERPNQTTEQFIKIGETLNVLKKQLDDIERGQLARNIDGSIETVQLRRSTMRQSIRPDMINKNLNDDNVLVNDSEMPDDEDLRNELFNPYWIEDKHLKQSKFEVLSTAEITFWKELIKNYLSPLVEDKEKQEKVKKNLKELRDKTVVTFFMLNALFVVVIFLLQVNKDQIHIKWPLEAKANITFNPVTYEITIYKKYLQLEPVGLAFIAFFASILVIQFISMLFHRFETLCHLLSNSPLTILQRKKTLTFREKLEQAKKRLNIKNQQNTRSMNPNSGQEDNRRSKGNLDQEYADILNEMKEDEERKEAEKIERRRSSLLPWRRMSYQNHRASKGNSFVNMGMQKIEEEI